MILAPGNYGYPEVAKAVQLGIISGKTAKNGTKYFDPGNQLTRGQMAKVLVEADKLKIRNTSVFLDVPTSNGFHDYISTLTAERITGDYADGTYQPSKSISRAHFAIFVARMLNDDFKPDQINTAPRYILDTTKTYVVEESWLGNGISSNATYLRSNVKDHAGWDLWEVITTNEAPTFMLLKEDATGSYTKFCDSEAGVDCEDRIYTDLKYPLVVGKSWKESNNSWTETLTIVSINRTISIKAGTFNNVVEVKSSDGFTRYFAPNVGIIKVDYNGDQYSAMSTIK